MIAALYLLKVMLCSCILLGYNWLALRNKAFHQWNRFYLLAITALSLLLPLVKIPMDADASHMARYISAASIDDSVVVFAKQKASFTLSAAQWASIFYIAVSVILLLIVLRATKGILNISKSYPRQKMHQLYFLNTDAKGAPFSFLNYLVWNRAIDLQSQPGQNIFRHELTHIQQKHTLDKIFLLLVLIPFWINPFFWIIRNELHAVHEFIADEKALQNESVDALSRMILNAIYPGQAYLLASPFFQSAVKRRLQMFTLKNQKINYMSRILVLPILFTVVVAFSIKQQDQKEKQTFFEQASTGLISDTVPGKTKVIVEEIPKKANTIIVEQLLKNDGPATSTGSKNKIYLAADTIVIKDIQVQSTKNAPPGLLIVNGVKMDKNALGDKTIVAFNVKIYSKNDPEAIRLFGDEAKDGVTVLDDVQILDKKESKIYLESLRDTVPKKMKDARVFTKVEVEPKFAGDWSAFLRKHLKADVPVNNGAPAGQYTVIAQFIVDEEGNISDLKTLTKHGYGMEAEVLRVMQLSPNWEPALQNGRKVTAYRKQPFTFVIAEE